jgi:Spy/CpxP family protein refolding chaperone
MLANISKTKFKGDMMQNYNLSRKNILLSISMLICMSTQITNADEIAHPDMKPSHCEQRPMPESQMDMLMPMPPYLHSLNLTDDQKDKIFAITYAQLPKLRELKIQKHESMTTLKKLASSDQFNEAKAEALATKLASLDKALILLHINTDTKIRAILSDDQKRKLSSFEDNLETVPHGHMPLPNAPIEPQH